MLEISDLHVEYGRVKAVRGVSFHVDSSEIVGLLGANGAGKSSILSAIAGVQTPRGNVTFVDRSILGMRPESIVRLGLSLVPEGRRVFNRLTVRENLKLASEHSKSSSFDEDAARLMESFSALSNKMDDVAGSLSGGQQQLLVIARALMRKPRLLMLDEPSLGLDPLMVSEVFSVITELRAEGMTVLLAEQNVARTMEVADRAYVLRQGSVVLEGSSAALTKRMDYEDAYLGPR